MSRPMYVYRLHIHTGVRTDLFAHVVPQRDLECR